MTTMINVVVYAFLLSQTRSATLRKQEKIILVTLRPLIARTKLGSSKQVPSTSVVSLFPTPLSTICR